MQKKCCLSYTLGVRILMNKEAALPVSLPCRYSFLASPPQIPSAHQSILTERTPLRANVSVFIITVSYTL